MGSELISTYQLDKEGAVSTEMHILTLNISVHISMDQISRYPTMNKENIQTAVGWVTKCINAEGAIHGEKISKEQIVPEGNARFGRLITTIMDCTI